MWGLPALCAGLLLSGGAGVACLSPATVLNGLALGPCRRVRGIPYGPGPRRMLDVYTPRHAQTAPVAVFYYGGSWQEGGKALYRFVGAALAARGVVTIIPDYRLYPQTRFPGFLEDSAAAFAWARRHAPAYGGDPSRVFVMGHSAGAYNAAMLALDPAWLAAHGLSPHQHIAGVIGLAGPYDFLPLTSPALRAIFGAPEHLARTQPINFVSSLAPPAFLAAGKADTVVDPGNSRRLAARLAAAGGLVQLKLYPGLGHRRLAGALSPVLRGLGPVLADCLAFISHHHSQRSAA